MKKFRCPICGNEIKIRGKHDVLCNNCNNVFNYGLASKKNKIKVLQHEALNRIINREHEKNITYNDNTHKNLLLEYYKIFSYRNLNLPYDDSKFFDLKFKYTEQELATVINHMIEHSSNFDKYEMNILIAASKNKQEYLNALENINNTDSHKGKEKDFREFLFPKTIIPETKEINFRGREGKGLLLIALFIYIVFALCVMVFTKSELKYMLLNVAFFIPTLIFTSGLMKVMFKKKRLLLTVFLFVIIYYLTTLPGYILLNDINIDINVFVNHFFGLISSPVDLMMKLLEGMEPYEM